ncbi:pyridoxine 5'-phosphate oxidase C-terminal domain-containing protein [Clavibacter michiganensis]|uniref:pyridoxine 5'-phosphate oxidase C-terminal domain-containing protein n=1 Tax=Clavibacter michiganensis TaxID=28447 RepID=UPI00311EACA7
MAADRVGGAGARIRRGGHGGGERRRPRCLSAPARADVDPGDWVLWRIRPVHVEFWQGSPDRRHARILFDRVGETWTRRGAAGERATPPA